jgi:hypothetical protein
MGSSGSVIQSELQCELNKPLDASDVITPRGESLKAEVIHMRRLLHQITNGGHLDGHLIASHPNHQSQEEVIQIKTEHSSDQLDFNFDQDEHSKKHKDPHRILGVNDEEMKRTPAMKKLGITDQEFQEATDILIHSGVVIGAGTPPRVISKTENLLGYSEEQQHRSKAVRQILGTSESAIFAERAEELGRVGREHQLED